MTPVIIMAGGLGLRLHRLTQDQPKPLLPVGSNTMLETVIEGFRAQGFRRIWLCVHYLADKIEAHLGTGGDHGVKIRYVQEDEPLGTAGALRLLPRFEQPFIVSNADVMFAPAVSYGHLMEHHARSNALMTVCGALHQHQVPFGVIDVDEQGRVSGVREKPIENFVVAAGVYVLDPAVLDLVPRTGVVEMPDVINAVPKEGARSGVSVYAHEGQWHDLGHFDTLAEVHYMRTLGAL